MYEKFGVSIHTSAREVTGTPMMTWLDLQSFNPHFRKGSDRLCWSHWKEFMGVSIHTSAREVTITI